MGVSGELRQVELAGFDPWLHLACTLLVALAFSLCSERLSIRRKGLEKMRELRPINDRDSETVKSRLSLCSLSLLSPLSPLLTSHLTPAPASQSSTLLVHSQQLLATSLIAGNSVFLPSACI
jgi:hypothetical protein